MKYAEEEGMSSGRSSRLLMYFGLVSCIARLITGRLCDLTWINLHHVFQVGGFISAIAVTVFPVAHNYSLFVLFTVMLGVGQGIIITTSNLTFLTCVDNKRRASAFGLANCLTSFATVSSPPLAGKFG